jgi:UDP-glucose 4-epimerase
MQALITGGAGFIGSHLAQELLRRGDDVVVIDDLSTGSIQNIEPLKSHPRFRYVIETIMNRSVMAELVDAADVIFHLAASVGVRLIIESPVRTIETNVRGTEIVLELAAKKRKKVLLASTSEVYGKQNRVPFNERDDLVLGPTHKGRWSYACSKALDEFLAIAYWKEKRLPVVVTRLFNTVGPRQTGLYGMVIPTFVGQALAGRPITIFGDGEQSRCFAWVGDTVGALIALANHPGAVGEVYNVGNDQEVRIVDVARLAKELTGSDSEIVFVPYDQAYEEGFEDMQRRVPDLSKLRAAVGYEPTLALREILQDVVGHISSPRALPATTVQPERRTAADASRIGAAGGGSG